MTTDSEPPPTTSSTDPTTSTTTTATTETTTTSTTTGEPETTTNSSTTSTATTETTATSEPPEPSCSDEQINQDETDVDCGGSCAPCLEGQTCAGPADCATGWCEGGVCASPECESDADCGALAGPCTAGSCTREKKCEAVPAHEGEACDDGDACTQVDTCAQGTCTGADPVDCSALDTFCGAGVCDPQSGACELSGKPGMLGEACDDGFVCTPDDTCQANGLCGPGGPGYALFEDFSGAAEGWSLGPTWEIGAALASPPAATGADPAEDRSPGADNRLAGVLIGGLSQGPGEQTKTCLTSPPVDTTGAQTAWLTFWRHLHTDHFPFVVNEIEVFDGIDWITAEVGYNNPGIDDPSWQQITLDVGEFSNEALQVRICYSRVEGALPFAGWSVDDVTIGPFACTPE